MGFYCRCVSVAREEKKDSEEYRKLMIDVLPNLLTHLKQLTSEREGENCSRNEHTRTTD